MTEQEAALVFKLMAQTWPNSVPSRETGAFATYFELLHEFSMHEVRDAINSLAVEGAEFFPLAGVLRRKVLEQRIDAPSWPQAILALREARAHLDSFVWPSTCIDGNPDCSGEGWVIRSGQNVVSRREPCECSPSSIERTRKMTLAAAGTPEPCSVGKCDGSGFVRVQTATASDVAEPCTCRPKLLAQRSTGLPAMLREFVNVVGWPAIKNMLEGNDTTLESQMRNKYADLVRERVNTEALAGLATGADAPARLRRANEEAVTHPSVQMPALRELN